MIPDAAPGSAPRTNAAPARRPTAVVVMIHGRKEWRGVASMADCSICADAEESEPTRPGKAPDSLVELSPFPAAYRNTPETDHAFNIHSTTVPQRGQLVFGDKLKPIIGERLATLAG